MDSEASEILFKNAGTSEILKISSNGPKIAFPRR